jgi:hypothetical protein
MTRPRRRCLRTRAKTLTSRIVRVGVKPNPLNSTNEERQGRPFRHRGSHDRGFGSPNYPRPNDTSRGAEPSGLPGISRDVGAQFPSEFSALAVSYRWFLSGLERSRMFAVAGKACNRGTKPPFRIPVAVSSAKPPVTVGVRRWRAWVNAWANIRQPLASDKGAARCVSAGGITPLHLG